MHKRTMTFLLAILMVLLNVSPVFAEDNVFVGKPVMADTKKEKRKRRRTKRT